MLERLEGVVYCVVELYWFAAVLVELYCVEGVYTEDGLTANANVAVVEEEYTAVVALEAVEEEYTAVVALEAVEPEPVQVCPLGQHPSVPSDLVKQNFPGLQLPSWLGQHCSSRSMQPVPHSFWPCAAQEYVEPVQVWPLRQQPPPATQY
ncbi:hypothetical protein BAUCODRAFT_147300 [Baudoinia panamericana UAMH 10762]|uniref:Uncharacterized protein n=1 Tax=Baudoinia panamericana (strain UAMH 10762) TaxID=717646 RepID=M2MKC6_BAUPA|nr:uncharacterized protein BAUCODRAFT_147300 [Baudoinia panamericana UAMH 10762]EMC97146.1 hypothetical protein BAUCODRAFT_147300 [Baudoinia panamericana UAMH 10762]